MTDDFDFGFTAVDEIPASETKQPVQAEVSSDQMDSIMDNWNSWSQESYQQTILV